MPILGYVVAKCGVPRNELFLTTKVWINNAVEEKVARSIEKSLRKLQTEYIDLLLLCAQVASKIIDIPNFHILLILLPVKPIRKQ